MRRQPGHLKSPSHKDFYPQHSPYAEAPYINSLSTPSLPYSLKAWTQQEQRDRMEDLERRRLKAHHCETALKDRERLEKKWKLERQQLDNARNQEKIDAFKRMQADKAKREARWTSKTSAHCFHVDLWAEDEQIYDQNRTSDAQARSRERAAVKAALKDQADRRKEKLGQVDVLDNLRKEKKKLQEDQKELKARLDLDKVDRRCAAAKYKADMKMELHQQKLADMGHLDRCASDFFTDKRLNPAESLKKFQKQAQKRNALRMSLTGRSSLTGQMSPMSLTDQQFRESPTGRANPDEDQIINSEPDPNVMDQSRSSFQEGVASDFGIRSSPELRPQPPPGEVQA